MDTKKRSNEDLLDMETKSSGMTTVSSTPSEAASAANMEPKESSSAMEIDSAKPAHLESVQPSPATHSAATMATENTQPLGSEANKRVKLTMEAGHTRSDFSPSVDLPDPSTETKGLADWVGKIDKDEHAASTSPTATETKTDDTRTSAPVTGTESTDTTTSQESVAGMESGQDHPDASSVPTTEPSHEAISGSIMAVASLSEPLVATLESLDNQSDPKANNNTSLTASNLTISSEHSDSASKVPTEGESTLKTSNPIAIMTIDEDSKTGDVVVTNSAESTTQDRSADTTLASSDKQDTSISELGKSLPDHGVRPTEKPQSTADPTPVESTTKIHSAKDTSNPAMADNGRISSKKATSPTSAGTFPHETNSTANPLKTSLSSTSTPQDPPRLSPIMTKDSSSAPNSDSMRSGHMDNNQTLGNSSQQTSLPPLSSIAGTPSHSVPQSSRPSRSSMSVSALLLNNDDDNEQDQDRSRRTAGIMFDPFVGNPSNRNRSISPPPSVAPPQHTTLPGQHHHSGPGTPQHPPAPHNGPSIPPPRSLASVRGRDGMEPPLSGNPDHSGYVRGIPEPNQSSRHSQDFTPTPGGTMRSSSKDYPADEVMESGGVIGYGSQRHRLPSPVGTRPHQEPLMGPGGSGGPVPMGGSGKLPGLGSVTGNVPPHAHDHHNRHRPMYRSEGTHHPPPPSVMNSGRPNSYSPNQHSSMTHSPPVNGHPHYPPNGPSHHHHPSGMVSNAPPPPMSNMVPAIERHVPRLIVNNDPSLKMNGQPEHFLGYYRYDPAVLLPAMQGNENSLLEVRVASTYLTYDNVKVKKREIWGTDIYTDDSDVVAMLIHSGFYIPPTSPQCTDEDSLQPTSQHHNFAPIPIKHICPGFDLAVTLRVMPKLIKYQGSIRNRIKSRTWNTGHDGVSLKIESIRKLGAGEALNKGRSQSKRRMKEYSQERLRVLANIHDETTESLQNERAMRTATFEFTHQGDPCFKYSPELVMDRHDGLSRKWTSWRLKKEVLILENEEERYEISLQHHAGTDARRFDQYRFAVISPRTSLSSWSKASYPLDSSDLTEVLYEDLDWQDFEWVERGVVIQPSQRDKHGSTSNGNGSMMEGIELTSKDGDIVMEDGEIHDGNKGTIHHPASSNKSEDNGDQQEGVFCVVSRLYWRPMTENGSTNRSIAPTLKPAEASVPPYTKSAPIANQPDRHSKEMSGHYPVNNVINSAQDRPMDGSSSTGVKAPSNVYSPSHVSKPNHEYVPIPSPIVMKENREEKKENISHASSIHEASAVLPTLQSSQPQQLPAPTTSSPVVEKSTTSSTELPLTATSATLTKEASQAMNKNLEPLTISPSSPTTAPSGDAKSIATPIVAPLAPPPAATQQPAVTVKSSSSVPTAAAVAPVDDEREEGELEEGEIESD
ncbi:hypothetical protein FBU30_006478 [Linnemannia zychae]|nr:hypothetical protein FBU30_006473 [Linnemannia zychae]KAF9923501.1 hypothetical protein FBU30_006478 [Linnemannia zychae]